MRSFDVINIENAYSQILREDLGLGPNAIQTGSEGAGGQGAMVLSMGGHGIPDAGKNPLDGENKRMAQEEVINTIEDAINVLQDLENSNKVEAWVLTKLATVADRIQSVKSYLNNNN